VAEKGGDRGDWTVVRSRKRKAMQPEARRRDRSEVSERHRGRIQVRARDQRATEHYGRQPRDQLRFPHVGSGTEGRVSKFSGGSNQIVDRRDRKNGQVGEDFASTDNEVSFYFTNFPDFMPVFQLRQSFEVCGILSDIYIARKRNFRGQMYGFLRFVNVRNKDKLALALNNVWIGQCRIWAREARFDRFASDSKVMNDVGRSKVEEGRAMVRVRGKGIKNIRVGKQLGEEGNQKDGTEGVQVVVIDKQKEKVVAPPAVEGDEDDVSLVVVSKDLKVYEVSNSAKVHSVTPSLII